MRSKAEAKSRRRKAPWKAIAALLDGIPFPLPVLNLKTRTLHLTAQVTWDEEPVEGFVHRGVAFKQGKRPGGQLGCTGYRRVKCICGRTLWSHFPWDGTNPWKPLTWSQVFAEHQRDHDRLSWEMCHQCAQSPMVRALYGLTRLAEGCASPMREVLRHLGMLK